MTKDGASRAAPVTGATPSPQAADIRDRWSWVEPSVWSERMLTRLESEPAAKWLNRWFAAQGLFSLEHGSCTYG